MGRAMRSVGAFRPSAAPRPVWLAALCLPAWLAACSGSSIPPNAPTLPANPNAAHPAPVNPALPMTSAGPTTFGLDAPGGMNGAPDGMNFVIPDPAAAQAAIGTLSDGSMGITLTASAASDAVVCTQTRRLAPTVNVKVRLKVDEEQPGAQPFMGLNLELRTRDEAGSLISPAEGRYTTLQVVRDAGDFTTVEGQGAIPAGATRGEVCLRFLESRGKVEVDSLTVEGLLPQVDAPAAEKIPPPTKRFELDEPGGGAGAPVGADFYIPKDAVGVTARAGAIDGTHASGFTFEVTQPGDALVCSSPFPVAGGGTMWAQGSARVRAVGADGRAFTGFSAEVRAYDAKDQVVAGPHGAFLPVRVWKAPTVGVAGDPELSPFGKEVVVPAGAVNAKICLRFAEATGAADVDWLGVTQAAAPHPTVPASP